MKTKAELEAVYRGSFLLSGIDLIIATLCAATGNAHFVFFTVLAVAMWAYGMYFKVKADGIGE